MQRLAEEMDKRFNVAFADFGMGRQGRLATSGMQTQWAPPIDVIERDNQLMVRAELPGLNTNDIKVEVMDDIFTISGERREEHEEDQQGYRVSERHITLELTERARDHLAAAGYDPNYGARPLKRLLQREIETTLGRKLLAGEISERARVVVDYNGRELTFASSPVAEAA